MLSISSISRWTCTFSCIWSLIWFGSSHLKLRERSPEPSGRDICGSEVLITNSDKDYTGLYLPKPQVFANSREGKVEILYLLIPAFAFAFLLSFNILVGDNRIWAGVDHMWVKSQTSLPDCVWVKISNKPPLQLQYSRLAKNWNSVYFFLNCQRPCCSIKLLFYTQRNILMKSVLSADYWDGLFWNTGPFIAVHTSLCSLKDALSRGCQSPIRSRVVPGNGAI